ncbi:hypothetical protein Ahy_A01g004279 [Arachis hypogaea]|uniref:Uncharacterized protein n=1 Tax=Arachis hypogaea TaxID=3818 RepID=A0A445EVL9_ARAHY|nr:hypothetical protein Ahy_A01g004279 [Arachis hypogaea]
MASMNLLGFSLSPQEQHTTTTHHHQTHWKENNYINQNLQLETSCNSNNNVDNNHHHHHQQPKLKNFLGGRSFADHHHDYGANSSGDYLFQNCSQPKVTAREGEGSAGGSGGSTNSIYHQHVLVKEVAMEVFEIWEKREEGLKIMVGDLATFVIWNPSLMDTTVRVGRIGLKLNPHPTRPAREPYPHPTLSAADRVGNPTRASEIGLGTRG